MTSHPTNPASPAISLQQTGVVIVDHGSRRAESNDMLLQIVERFARQSHYPIVEPAHMELAEPSIPTAIQRCLTRGAKQILVMPYFLLPGKHWHEDIPRLTAQALADHPEIQFLVTAPLGLHPMMLQVIEARINHCLQHAGGLSPECEVCSGRDICTLRSPAKPIPL